MFFLKQRFTNQGYSYPTLKERTIFISSRYDIMSLVVVGRIILKS